MNADGEPVDMDRSGGVLGTGDSDWPSIGVVCVKLWDRDRGVDVPIGDIGLDIEMGDFSL